MAECLRFSCTHCGRSIEAWSDGNPYYIDEEGEKQYAYHPDDDLVARCIGNDEPHFCLNCGLEFKVDSRLPVRICPECRSPEIVDTFQLAGRRCPCRSGKFGDPEGCGIS